MNEIKEQLELMSSDDRKMIILEALSLNRKDHDHHRCDCEQLTYMCLAHGVIRGSEKQLVETSDTHLYYDEDE